jgi:hypothetical protein
VNKPPVERFAGVSLCESAVISHHIKHAGLTVLGKKGSQMSLSVRKVSAAIIVGCAAAAALGVAGVSVTAQPASGTSSLAFTGRHHWDDDGDHNHYDHNRYDHNNNHNRYGDDGLIVLDLL